MLKSVYNSYIDVISYSRLNKQKVVQADGTTEDKFEFSNEEKEKFHSIASTDS